MTELVLTLRAPLSARLDAAPLAPDRLALLSREAVERLSLRFEHGEAVAVADVFAVSGGSSDVLRVVGELSQVDGLGRGMASGTLIVDGDAGRNVGAGMTGGRIEVTGDAGDGLGTEAAGGTIVVRGSVGRGTGGAWPGGKRGMTGGEIVVFGDAGADTGACLRRGLIAVAGNVGPGTAKAAIAGTVVVGGDCVGPAGRWSKRASVVALGAVAVPPTYGLACTYRPPFVALLLTHLRRTHGFPASAAQAAGLYRRYAGDFAELGLGEILHWTGE